MFVHVLICVNLPYQLLLLALPGQPIILNGIADSTSINILARLPTKGTPPLKTLYTILSSPGYPIRAFTKYNNLELGEEVRVAISGLVPNVSYTVRMYTDNEAGFGPLSPEKTFTTGEMKLFNFRGARKKKSCHNVRIF